MNHESRKLEFVAVRQPLAGAVGVPWYTPALRKTGVAIVGFAVLSAGVAFIFLPAPSVVVIPLGLAILAREFLWARKLLEWSRARVRRSWIMVKDRFAKLARVSATRASLTPD